MKAPGRRKLRKNSHRWRAHWLSRLVLSVRRSRAPSVTHWERKLTLKQMKGALPQRLQSDADDRFRSSKISFGSSCEHILEEHVFTSFFFLNKISEYKYSYVSVPYPSENLLVYNCVHTHYFSIFESVVVICLYSWSQVNLDGISTIQLQTGNSFMTRARIKKDHCV
jgi:hypothetical protein